MFWLDKHSVCGCWRTSVWTWSPKSVLARPTPPATTTPVAATAYGRVDGEISPFGGWETGSQFQILYSRNDFRLEKYFLGRYRRFSRENGDSEWSLFRPLRWLHVTVCRKGARIPGTRTPRARPVGGSPEPMRAEAGVTAAPDRRVIGRSGWAVTNVSIGRGRLLVCRRVVSFDIHVCNTDTATMDKNPKIKNDQTQN